MQTASWDPCLFVNGLCNNVTDRQQPPSPIATESVLYLGAKDLGAKEDCSSSMAGDANDIRHIEMDFIGGVSGARTYNTKGLKKGKRKLSHNQD